jgi:hypothetical protein
MFVDESLERVREACRAEIRSLCAQEARIKQRLTELVRAADDRGDWQAAVNRPGFGGHFRFTRGRGYASTEEVPAGVAGARAADGR